MQPTLLLPCLVALLAWPAATTKHKQYHVQAPAQEKVTTHLHAAEPTDDKLHRVLQLLSVDQPKVRGQQTTQNENDAAKIANQIQLNHRSEVKKLLDAMYLHGGAKRITSAMPSLLKLGYRREGVYQWLNAKTSEPPARTTPDSVEVEDSKIEQAEEDKVASMKKYFDSQLETLNEEDTQSTPDTMDEALKTVVKQAQTLTNDLRSDSQGRSPSFRARQPEQFGMEPDTMDEASKTVMKQAQPPVHLVHSEELSPLEKLDSVKVRSAAASDNARALSKLDAVVKQVTRTNAAGTHVEPENAAESEAIEAHLKRFMKADARDAPKTIKSEAIEAHVERFTKAIAQDAPKTVIDSVMGTSPSSQGPKQPASIPHSSPAAQDAQQLANSPASQEDQQAQIDAAIMMSHIRRGDSEGLHTVYDEMLNHGGKGRIERAEAIASKMHLTGARQQATVQPAR